MTPSPAHSVPWMQPTTSTTLPDRPLPRSTSQIGRPRVERPSNNRRRTAPLAGEAPLDAPTGPGEPFDPPDRAPLQQLARQTSVSIATEVTRATPPVAFVPILRREYWATELPGSSSTRPDRQSCASGRCAR